MKRRFLAAALSAALLLTLAACGTWEEPADAMDDLANYYKEENDAPVPTAITDFTLPYSPGSTVEPVNCSDGIQQTLGALLYEGLFQLDEHFLPQPVLADSVTYDPDTFTYFITLKDGIVFSDGSPISSWDVASTLRRALESERYGERLRHVQSIDTAVGMVIIHLTEDIRHFTARLDIPIVQAGTEKKLVPTGSGPYVWVTEGSAAHLARNENWWQDDSDSLLPRIELLPCKSADYAFYAFSSRDVQLMACDLTSSANFPTAITGDYAQADTPTLQYLGFNTFAGAFYDPALRRALSTSLNRSSLISACLMGYGEAAQFPIHPASTIYPAELEVSYTANALDTALAQKGYSAREPMEATLVVNEENSFKVALAREIARALQSELLTLTVVTLPWEQFQEALFLRNYDIYLGEVTLTADWDATSLLSSGGALNFGDFSDPVLDELLLAYRAADDDTLALAAEKLCRQMQENVPIAPLLFKESSVLTTAGVVDGLSPTAADPFYHMSQWKVHLGQNR